MPSQSDIFRARMAKNREVAWLHWAFRNKNKLPGDVVPDLSSLKGKYEQGFTAFEKSLKRLLKDQGLDRLLESDEHFGEEFLRTHVPRLQGSTTVQQQSQNATPMGTSFRMFVPQAFTNPYSTSFYGGETHNDSISESGSIEEHNLPFLVRGREERLFLVA